MHIRPGFDPGEQLLKIVTANEDSREFNRNGRWEAEARGETTGHYEIRPTDMLIIRDRHGYDNGPVVVAADAPLPSRTDDWSWRPLGIITTASKLEGRLVTWSGAGAAAQWLVEASVASYVMATPTDYDTLRYEVGGRSLVASVANSDLARTYLGWFFDEFSGVDFTPSMEPADRWGTF